MDQVIGFVVLLLILSLLERVLRGQKGKTRRPPAAEDGWEATGEERDTLEGRGISLRDLLAEELGLNLERTPTVRRPPETPSGGADSAPASQVDRAAAAPPIQRPESAAPPDIERVDYYPTPRRPKRKLGPAGPAAAAALRTAEARKLKSSIRRGGSAVRPRRTGDERLPVRRAQAASLERPRRPEDHQLFHDRYGVPQPVSSHEEYHERYVDSPPRKQTRRGRVALPDDPQWSAVQRAIVWSEVLGPPKGLA
jgi:hypothetical protein